MKQNTNFFRKNRNYNKSKTILHTSIIKLSTFISFKPCLNLSIISLVELIQNYVNVKY